MSNTILDEWSDEIPGGGYVHIEEYPGDRLPFLWTIQAADDTILGRGEARTKHSAWNEMKRAVRGLREAAPTDPEKDSQ